MRIKGRGREDAYTSGSQEVRVWGLRWAREGTIEIDMPVTCEGRQGSSKEDQHSKGNPRKFDKSLLEGLRGSLSAGVCTLLDGSF